MKNEINNTNKARFFALYWGQEIAKYPEALSYLRWNIKDALNDGVENRHILLNPLSLIADKHLLNCYHLHSAFTSYDYTIGFTPFDVMINNWMDHGGYRDIERCPDTVDYLRSKGYALPWMGLSVQEMIDAGWIKLK